MFFEFTFKKEDTFKHTLKFIEKYVRKNIKQKLELDWEPEILIQVLLSDRSVKLQEGLADLNRLIPQCLYISVCSGATIYNHLQLFIKYDRDEKVWVVDTVQNPAWF